MTGMDPEFSRRLGQDLGHYMRWVHSQAEWDAARAMENRICDWASNNRDASWETMPDDLRAYILKVEGSSSASGETRA